MVDAKAGDSPDTTIDTITLGKEKLVDTVTEIKKLDKVKTKKEVRAEKKAAQKAAKEAIQKEKAKVGAEVEGKYVVQLTEAYGFYTRNDNVVVTEGQRNKMLKAGVIKL